MTRHFPFIGPKNQNELDFESGRPPRPSRSRLARPRNNTFAFFGPTVLTPAHWHTMGHRLGVRRHGQGPPPALISRSGSLLVSPHLGPHLTGVASSWHRISIRCNGPCLVNSPLTHAGWPWRRSLISRTFLSVCQPINSQHSRPGEWKSPR